MKKNRFRRKISLMMAPHIPAGSASARSAWRWLVLCMTFSLALGCTGCGAGGGSGASAASMFLRKTEGTVAVADAEGADIEPAENLGLYSGYTVGTGEESYAWIDLDKVKLAKLDENSAAEITKDGKNLSIDVQAGGLFFNVTEPLADDETMEITTSSMMVGIRGTCGWVTQNSAALLEGTVTVTAGEQSVTITAGEYAWLTDDGALEVWELTFASIPSFVARELLDDEALHQTVFEASGLRIPTTYEELADTLEDVVYSEVIDFEADGNPELLVIQPRVYDERYGVRIYRMGTEGLEDLLSRGPAPAETATRYSCWLAERDGRWYVCCQTDLETFTETVYFGSVAAQDGGREDWGETDLAVLQGGSIARVCQHNERGFVFRDENGHSKTEEYNGANFEPYTFVRELYATAP